jgi:hypothetical protein
MGACSLPASPISSPWAPAPGAPQDRYLLGAIQNFSKYVEFIIGRTHGRFRLGEKQARLLLNRISQGHIPWNHDDGNATLCNRGLDRNLEHTRHLFGLRDELTVMAALSEDVFRMSLLEVSTTDFNARNLRRDGENRDAAALAIVKAIDQMQVSGSAASGAYSQFAGEMRLRPRRERACLLVAHADPLDILAGANRIRDAIERIAGDAVNALNARSHENVYQQVRHSLCHSVSLSNL